MNAPPRPPPGARRQPGPGATGTALHILRISTYRRIAILVGAGYLVLFLLAIRDITPGGGGLNVLVTEWRRMFERTGTFTFEPVAALVVPGFTVLVSPVNVLIGSILSALAGLNLAVTWVALRQPRACRFNRAAGVLASVPALLAGSACCAPVIVLLLGLQLSSLLVAVFQVLIPASFVLLVVTLKLVLDRTDADLLEDPFASPPAESPR